ncbi:MAG: hypothetical protein IKX83_04720, partial [Clostridia bacterium]|nr:hypothetical protein [Clostridia bacterium]
MEWLNVYGLVFVVVLLIPNIVYAVRHKNDTPPEESNKALELLEQIGRFGCLFFMVFHMPGSMFGWWSDEAFAIYLIVDTVLVLAYCLMWVVFRKKTGVAGALTLSILPSALFFFSGLMTRSIPLVLASIIFAATHISISYKNAVQ